MLFGKYTGKIILRYILFFILGIGALIMVNYFQLEIPEIFGKVVDGINDGTILDNNVLLLQYVRNILIVLCIMFIGRFSWRVFVIGGAINIETDLRSLMFNHAEKLSRDYYKQNKTGALMALFSNDLQIIKNFFSNGTVMIVDFLVLGIFTLTKMFRLSTKLTVIVLIPSVILGVAIFFFVSKLDKKFSKQQKAFENLSDFTQENFSGLSVVKAFVNEDVERKKFSTHNANHVKMNMNIIKYLVAINILLDLLLSVITILIVMCGGQIILFDGTGLTVGELLEFMNYFDILSWPIIAVGQYLNMRTQAMSSYKRIRNFLDSDVDIVDNNNYVDVNGKIEFRNLSFKYFDSDVNVLNDVSFTINPGEFVGILGKTGSGKTTIVDLLLRIYNIDKGMLFIDDKDIMDISIKSIRDNIGYVPQDNFLFSDTIRNNIGFSGTDYNEDEIVNSAIDSDIHSNIIDFPNQYNTVLGERGVTLSGGQKQRVSIARALIKDPQIIIFDDSLSAVDTKTEKKILNNLLKARRNKTTIMIASRISTVMYLDKIILVDNGRVVGVGNHNELLKTSELYRHMVQLQSLESEVSE